MISMHVYICQVLGAIVLVANHEVYFRNILFAVLLWLLLPPHSFQTASPGVDSCKTSGWLWTTRCTRVLHCCPGCASPSFWGANAHAGQHCTLWLHRGSDLWRKAAVWCHLPGMQVRATVIAMILHSLKGTYARYTWPAEVPMITQTSLLSPASPQTNSPSWFVIKQAYGHVSFSSVCPQSMTPVRISLHWTIFNFSVTPQSMSPAFFQWPHSPWAQLFFSEPTVHEPSFFSMSPQSMNPASFQWAHSPRGQLLFNEHTVHAQSHMSFSFNEPSHTQTTSGFDSKNLCTVQW